MNHTLRLLPQVEDDAFAAFQWYEQRSSGLGESFLQTFYTDASGITSNPFLYTSFYRKVRRCLIKRFPYSIYFKIVGDEVVVVGLFHCARNPKTVRKYLRSRAEPESR